jgi:hypothetical protein
MNRNVVAYPLVAFSAPVVALKLQKVEREKRSLSRAPVRSQGGKVAVTVRPEDDRFAIYQSVVDGQGARTASAIRTNVSL